MAVFFPVPDDSNHVAIDARHVAIQRRFTMRSLVSSLALASERHVITKVRNFVAKDVVLVWSRSTIFDFRAATSNRH